MKHLQIFEAFNRKNKKKDIHDLCNKYGIVDYTIKKDGSIDVDNNVDLSFKYLTKLPLKFNKVNGSFSCYYNELTSLEGCPNNIGDSFFCSNNLLTSLKGCPKIIPGVFSCYTNKLISLEGCPENISGVFCCDTNMIKSFEYFPKHIGGIFNCDENPINIIWRLFEDKSKIELFNDMDIIQDDTIIIDRLNYFLEEIGKEPVNAIHLIFFKNKGYKYI